MDKKTADRQGLEAIFNGAGHGPFCIDCGLSLGKPTRFVLCSDGWRCVPCLKKELNGNGGQQA